MATLPVVQDVNATANSLGVATFRTILRQAMWSSVSFIGTAKTSGNVTWQISSAGTPLAQASGPQGRMGPVLIPPGADITITLTGNAGDSFTGSINGAASDTLDGLQATGASGGGAGSGTTSAVLVAPSLITKLSPVAGPWTSAVFTLPAGTTQVLVQWPASATNPPGSPGSFSLIGNTTGSDYFNEASANVTANGTLSGFVSAPIGAADTQLYLVTDFATPAPTVWVSALFVPVTSGNVVVIGQAGSQPIIVETSNATTLPVILDNVITGGTPLNVTTQTYNIRQIQLTSINHTTRNGQSLTTFGGSPFVFWQNATVGTDTIYPTIDAQRMTSPSGFKFTSATNCTILGQIFTDTDS